MRLCNDNRLGALAQRPRLDDAGRNFLAVIRIGGYYCGFGRQFSLKGMVDSDGSGKIAVGPKSISQLFGLGIS